MTFLIGTETMKYWFASMSASPDYFTLRRRGSLKVEERNDRPNVSLKSGDHQSQETERAIVDKSIK
ncbi:MAG: hypothetical protein ACI8RD_012991 [Bacillariaceae sp.]|jgi:hypothetical protein